MLEVSAYGDEVSVVWTLCSVSSCSDSISSCFFRSQRCSLLFRLNLKSTVGNGCIVVVCEGSFWTQVYSIFLLMLREEERLIFPDGLLQRLLLCGNWMLRKNLYALFGDEWMSFRLFLDGPQQ